LSTYSYTYIFPFLRIPNHSQSSQLTKHAADEIPYPKPQVVLAPKSTLVSYL